MMTVRFPSGFSVQYNEAQKVTYVGEPAHTARLSTSNDRWIADVSFSSGALLESSVGACKTYDAATHSDLKSAISAVRNNMRGGSYSEQSELIELKRELAEFNIQRRTWRKS